MNGRELLVEALKAAGYGCDRVNGGFAGFSCWTCRITQAEVRKLVGNKNWHPVGLDTFDPPGVLRLWVGPIRGRR